MSVDSEKPLQAVSGYGTALDCFSLCVSVTCFIYLGSVRVQQTAGCCIASLDESNMDKIVASLVYAFAFLFLFSLDPSRVVFFHCFGSSRTIYVVIYRSHWECHSIEEGLKV